MIAGPVRWTPWLAGLLLSVQLLGAVSFEEQRNRLQAELASGPARPETLLELGKLCHNESALDKSDAKATEKLAGQYLRQLLQLSPTNAFGRALLGSTLTLGARHAFLPTTRIRLVREGLVEMDAAVEAAPEDANVRFTRAANNVFLPDYFRRRETVMSDFRLLAAQVAREPDRHTEEFRQYVALYQGIAHRRYGELDKAAEVWQSGLAVNPDSAVSQLIRREQNRKSS
jgi:tetratricopeptide (TPR) repeat protein